MKIINPRIHGFSDYAYSAILLLAPSLFGFGDVATTVSYALGIGQLTMSLITIYPLGVVKVVPFPIHGGIEFVISVAMLVMPWMMGFAADATARVFFLSAGVALLSLWLVSDYQGSEEQNSVYYDERHTSIGGTHGSLRL